MDTRSHTWLVGPRPDARERRPPSLLSQLSHSTIKVNARVHTTHSGSDTQYARDRMQALLGVGETVVRERVRRTVHDGELLGRLAGVEAPRSASGLEEDAVRYVLLENVRDDVRLGVETLLSHALANLVDAHALLGTRVDGGEDRAVDGFTVGNHGYECLRAAAHRRGESQA